VRSSRSSEGPPPPIGDKRLSRKDRLSQDALSRDVLSKLRSLDDEAVTRALRSLPPAILHRLLRALER
jgi:hypothetical protein